MSLVRSEFTFHKLNEDGQARARHIANIFTVLVTDLENICADATGAIGGREFSIVKTKLEEACFFAKKTMATHTHNQEL